MDLKWFLLNYKKNPKKLAKILDISLFDLVAIFLLFN